MILRSLFMSAARRVASDPKMQAKAKQVFNENARPILEQKAREAKQMASDREPGEHPARFAGRAFKKLLDG
jgi:hypothetical protein